MYSEEEVQVTNIRPTVGFIYPDHAAESDYPLVARQLDMNFPWCTSMAPICMPCPSYWTSEVPRDLPRSAAVAAS